MSQLSQRGVDPLKHTRSRPTEEWAAKLAIEFGE
jgi:hypothetical protein